VRGSWRLFATPAKNAPLDGIDHGTVAANQRPTCGLPANIRENTMEIDKMMDGMAAELVASLKAMGKAKTVEEKLQYSQVVKNLSESFSAIITAAGDIIPFDEDEIEE
jgi:hypothetical protein